MLCTGGDDEIGDAEDVVRDSQENLAEGEFVGFPSSCDEISNDLFSDGEAGEAPDEELYEMLGWPLELLHAPDRGKKRVRRNRTFGNGEHDQDQRRSMAGPSGIANPLPWGMGSARVAARVTKPGYGSRVTELHPPYTHYLLPMQKTDIMRYSITPVTPKPLPGNAQHALPVEYKEK